MAELSNVTEMNDNEITQSTLTVQTIVGILVRIADVSQNIVLNKTVMEVCTIHCVSTKDISQIVANQNFFLKIKYMYIVKIIFTKHDFLFHF